MKNVAAIFAGGIGTRMGSNIPKQFLEIYGKPILLHTIEKFEINDLIDEIYIGCKEEFIPLLEKYLNKYSMKKIKKANIISGGSTGLETIYKLLKKISSNHDEAIVLIHDGVRPNITDDVITKNIESVKKYGSAITCVPTFETSVVSENGIDIDKFLERKKVYTAKAPQSFKLSEILKSYEKVLEEYKTFDVKGLIDSCSVAMHNGISLKMIEGNRDNIKVTTSNDYIEILGRMVATDYMNFLTLEESKKNN